MGKQITNRTVLDILLGVLDNPKGTEHHDTYGTNYEIKVNGETVIRHNNIEVLNNFCNVYTNLIELDDGGERFTLIGNYHDYKIELVIHLASHIIPDCAIAYQLNGRLVGIDIEQASINVHTTKTKVIILIERK